MANFDDGFSDQNNFLFENENQNITKTTKES